MYKKKLVPRCRPGEDYGCMLRDDTNVWELLQSKALVFTRQLKRSHAEQMAKKWDEHSNCPAA